MKAEEALKHASSGATILSKLGQGLPPDGFEAIEAVRESDGVVLSLDGEEALDGQLSCRPWQVSSAAASQAAGNRYSYKSIDQVRRMPLMEAGRKAFIRQQG